MALTSNTAFEKPADEIINLIEQAAIDLKTIRAEWDLGSPPGMYDPEVYRTYRNRVLSSMEAIVNKLSSDVSKTLK